MKSFAVILVAVAIASVAAAEQICEPNSRFYDYCNICHCSDDGEKAACTQMACDKAMFNKDGSLRPPYNTLIRVARSAEEKFCEPNKEFNDYCNYCVCNPSGSNAACTRMYCDTDVWNKDGTLKIQLDGSDRVRQSVEKEQVCEPGKRFKDYCNSCICSKDGSNYACTRMACDEKVWNRDGTLKIKSDRVARSVEKEQVCEPGKSFKDYCNSCVCLADGLNAACTAMACNPDVFNKDGSLKNVAAAKRAPREEEVSRPKHWGPLYHHGDSCNPGHAFYSECNQCICLDSGRSAYCTRIKCPKLP